MVVSCSPVPYKAIAVPFSADGSLCAKADDFSLFGKSGTPKYRTEMYLWHDSQKLHLRVISSEPKGVSAVPCPDGAGVWNGSDMLEIFFGAVEPEGWLFQFAVTAAGARFDSTGKYDLWSAKTTVNADSWTAELEFPLSRFRFANSGMFFNVCRSSKSSGEYPVWSKVRLRFHETESFGELLFTDYNSAFFARTGEFAGKPLSRELYETELRRRAVPAVKLVHGPWLSNPDERSMTVSFATAGRCGAFVDFRKQGDPEWVRVPCGHQNGLLVLDRNFHAAHLSGLEPGTGYEYRPVTVAPVTNEIVPSAESGTFRTFDSAEKKFSFLLFSDVHSNRGLLEHFLKTEEAGKARFAVNLGDMLSCMSGDSAFYDGFLDAESALFAGKKPLVFVRGNHEYEGMFASGYAAVMPHPSGKTYYAFRQGEVCFLVLDAGTDHADSTGIWRFDELRAEEREWLRQIVISEPFVSAKFRIALMHMPPYDNALYHSNAALSVIDGILTEPGTVDLMLCGHVHKYFRIDPMTGKCFYKRENRFAPNAPLLPFPVVANDTDTMTVGTASPGALNLRVISGTGKTVDELEFRIPESR